MNRQPARWTAFLVPALLLAFTLIMFRELVPASRILFTTDNNIGVVRMAKEALPEAITGYWLDNVLAGTPSGLMPVTWSSILMAILPVQAYNDWIYAIYLLTGSLALFVFLRGHGLRREAALAGMLAAMWIGTNFTTIYAGHTAKFGILMMAPVFLLCIQRIGPTRFEWSALAGVAMAFMFLEQADVALFVGLGLAAYTLFHLVRTCRPRWGRIAVHLGVMLLFWIGMCGHQLLASYGVFVKDVAAFSGDDTTDKWNYVTQWSYPPEDTIDLVAPGFTGWRSGEPEGPYWGRMGQSAEWNTSRQGFMNFRLDNVYLGAVPILLALCALLWRLAGRGGEEDDSRRGEVAFWGLFAAAALVLAFGKFTPVYSIFYKLPAVSSVRNPYKFMALFQLAIGILTAHGLDLLLRNAERKTTGKKAASTPGWVRISAGFAWGFAILFATLALANLGGLRSLTGRFAEWGQLAPVIARNIARSLGHAAVAGAAMGLVMRYLSPAKGTVRPLIPRLLAWGPALLVAGDALWLAPRYMMVLPAEAVAENEVIRLLKSVQPQERTALVSQDGFYNHWLTYLLPYHDIQAVNFTQMPRMPVDYQQFLQALGSQPLRLWQLFSVRHVLAPSAFLDAVARDPAARDLFEPVLRFRTEPADGFVRVVTTADTSTPHHVVLKMRATSPRIRLASGWAAGEDLPRILQLLQTTHNPISDPVLIDPVHAVGLPPMPGSGSAGEAVLKSYRAGRMEIHTRADVPGLLRVTEKYDAGWKALVDGHAETIRRCDFIFQCVWVPAGEHDIVLQYAPPSSGIWVQLVTMGLGLGALGVAFFRARPSETTDA